MKKFIDSNFKNLIIVFGLICTISTLKQQYDLYQIKEDLSYIESEIDDTKSKLNSVESNLSDEIDAVRRAVIVWSD